jgi:hypothetical protein
LPPPAAAAGAHHHCGACLNATRHFRAPQPARIAGNGRRACCAIWCCAAPYGHIYIQPADVGTAVQSGRSLRSAQSRMSGRHGRWLNVCVCAAVSRVHHAWDSAPAAQVRPPAAGGGYGCDSGAATAARTAEASYGAVWARCARTAAGSPGRQWRRVRALQKQTSNARLVACVHARVHRHRQGRQAGECALAWALTCNVRAVQALAWQSCMTQAAITAASRQQQLLTPVNPTL